MQLLITFILCMVAYGALVGFIICKAMDIATECERKTWQDFTKCKNPEEAWHKLNKECEPHPYD